MQDLHIFIVTALWNDDGNAPLLTPHQHHASTTKYYDIIILLGFGMMMAPHHYWRHTSTAPVPQNIFIFRWALEWHQHRTGLYTTPAPHRYHKILYSDGLWNDTSTALVVIPDQHRTGTTKYCYIILLMGFGITPAPHRYHKILLCYIAATFWYQTSTAPAPAPVLLAGISLWYIAVLFPYNILVSYDGLFVYK